MLKRTEKNKKSFLPRTSPGQFYNFNLYLRKNLGVKRVNILIRKPTSFSTLVPPPKHPLLGPISRAVLYIIARVSSGIPRWFRGFLPSPPQGFFWSFLQKGGVCRKKSPIVNFFWSQILFFDLWVITWGSRHTPLVKFLFPTLIFTFKNRAKRVKMVGLNSPCLPPLRSLSQRTTVGFTAGR